MPYRVKRPAIVRDDGAIALDLGHGLFAVIDGEDAWAAACNWSARRAHKGRKVYAAGGDRHQLLHRQIVSAPDGMDVDHIDGDTLNCRRSNLRIVSRKENVRNRRLNSNNTTGALGVRDLEDGRWSAHINGIYLGTYYSFAEAVAARSGAERALWGVQPQRTMHLNGCN